MPEVHDARQVTKCAFELAELDTGPEIDLEPLEFPSQFCNALVSCFETYCVRTDPGVDEPDSLVNSVLKI